MTSSPSSRVVVDLYLAFLSKEVYGRIKPANYLLLFLIALGAKNTKLYIPVIMAVQKLFANNFISADEELSGTLQFIKE